jgi:hypothetical protein
VWRRGKPRKNSNVKDRNRSVRGASLRFVPGWPDW